MRLILFFVFLLEMQLCFANGLTLRSSDINDPIEMVCNGKKFSQDILPYQYIKNIQWNDLVAYAGSSVLRCEFYLNNKSHENIASGVISVNVLEDEGAVLDFSVQPTYYFYVAPEMFRYSKRVGITVQRLVS